jgi:GNAT superfamily N-acetyltransferase
MMALLQQLDERKKALVPDPHWYLAAIGVDPAKQGGGLGSKLVRLGIARADRDNVAIYLETETESNLGFHEHLGFEVLEEATASGLGLPIWLMVRHPVTTHRGRWVRDGTVEGPLLVPV